MNIPFSLEKNAYSVKNAMLWGLFRGHCNSASRGRLGDRIVHGLIAAAEFLPVIGQIASLFEMAIVLRTATSSNILARSPNILSKNELPLNPQKVIKKTLVPLSPEKTTGTVHLSLWLPKEESAGHFSTQATFYRYNSESIEDSGWGCAWRAIQTCLSTYNITIEFRELFSRFGDETTLKALYSSKYSGEEQDMQGCAPHNLASGWAEPFIGEMVLHDHKIPSSLLTVNGKPGCHAPKAVFHDIEPLKFSAFKTKLVQHFSKEGAAPVMIDDGTYAMNIIGVQDDGSSATLWIADPHVRETASTAKTRNPCGLYTVTLNDSGNQISCSLDAEDTDQKKHLSFQGSYRGLTFAKKQWMVLFPGADEEV